MDAHATGPLLPSDPRTLGGHRLLGRIGAGGMGTVYLGEDRTGRQVAVKVIHPELAMDPGFRARFSGEADLAGRVASFCTATVLDHGEDDGRPYLVSEYVGGMTLERRITGDGPLPPADLHGVAVGVATALAAIHSAGLVHRDLKPANVVLTLSGCRVIDFGIARGQDSTSTLTGTGTALGTPGWMPPEVLAGHAATTAADIFAWGCLVVRAGTGRLPFDTEGRPPAEAALRVMNDEPDLTGLPESLAASVRSALAKDPEDRPAASELMLTLVERQETPRRAPTAAQLPAPLAVPAPGPVPLPPGSGDTQILRTMDAPQPAPRSALKTRLLAGAGAAVATVLIGALIMGMTGGDNDKAADPAPTTSAPAPPPPAPSIKPKPKPPPHAHPRKPPKQPKKKPRRNKHRKHPG
ncbi:serine/threonine protein kinase [Actinomadura barringtoniae]|uniref:Serine/threonine protein kinase n=1 Tax=Actinomadura barringtoniae TaxID=1427535 RepID=A0A939P6G4_9ACTN|nr:serine/threonine-protein kinase [Actinomadura barringtoniae]MBO2445742.1 serine/threonine protein kinase [Actinomadura barringtoniae]